MARFPKTIGDILASHSSYSRELGTSALGTAELAPITFELLDEELQTNKLVVDADMVLVKNTMAQLNAVQANNVSTLVRLDDDLATLDGRLVGLDADLVVLDAAMIANNAAQAQLDADLIALDATMTTTKTQVDATLVQVNSDLAELDIELAAVPGRIQTAIDASNAIPFTNERFQENSLSIWPFINQTIPKGAFDVGAVTGPDLEDFSVHAKKFNDKRHRLY